MRYVIIGNGVAGIHGAEAIRQMDPEGQITIVSDETFLPYCRPMISMVLEGSAVPGNLPIRRESFYDDLNITPVLGRRVTGIDVEGKRVLLPDDCAENSLPFDKLLIATGADPRPVKADGLGLKNIFYMRTQAHVRGMIEALSEVKTALVLGGGLVGFKAAYSLMKRGIKVVMLIRSDYPLSMQVDETAGMMIQDELIQKGLDVRIGVEAAIFEGNGRVKTAHLSDGTRIPCGMVVIGKGVVPALSFVPRKKIQVDLGIMVNEHMETSVSGIYAAGDAAEFIDIARQNRWVNAIWPEAVAQGRIAGMNMAGRPVAYEGSLSRNVIRIFDMDIMTGGVVNPPDNEGYDVVAAKTPRTYRKLVFRDDKLVGMIMVNQVEQGGMMLSLIRSRMPVMVSKEKLLDPGLNYRRMMRMAGRMPSPQHSR